MSTEQLLHLLQRIGDRVQAVTAEGLHDRGMEALAPSHAEVLTRLLQADGLAMAELADRIGRDKSTATALVKKLSTLGLVVPRKDSRDARVTRVWLTDAGRGLRPSLDALQHQLLTRAYRGLSWPERAELMRLLERVQANL